MTYAQHPLSAAFPAMCAEDFQSLKDSIENIGVQNPVTLFEGMVIDGWHRYSAAMELGMDCPTVELGEVDPRDFVLAQNKARRHITQAQLVACASAVFNWRPNGGDQSALSADCTSSKQVADKTGASVRTVEQFREVERKASPEVVEAVKRGEIGLPKAAAIAKLPKEQQAEAIGKPMSASKPKAAEPAEPAYPPPDEDLKEMLLDMQRECESYARRLADWERVMQSEGKSALVTAIKRYEHAEREKALADERASQYMKQRDRYLRDLKACGKAVGETDIDKVARAVQGFARKQTEEAGHAD